MTRTRFDSRRPTLEALEDRLVPSTVAGSYADGVWRFDTTAGWAHISTRQTTLLDVDDAGDVYGQFSDGIWRWSAATASWAHPSSLTTDAFQVTAGGIFYGDFGNNGVWRWNPATNSWAQLSNFNVSGITVSDSDAFFGTFDTGAVGSWRWTPTAGWSLLTANLPIEIKTDAAGDFVGLFDGAGVSGTWRWSPTAGWARPSTTTPASIAVSANGAIFEFRGINGIWRAAPGAISFTQIDTNDAIAATLMALPDGSLYAERRVLGDAHWTGWYWSASLPAIGVVKFLPNVDNILVQALGKDGDLFFKDGTIGASGTGYFSALSAYHLLGGLNTQTPSFLASQR
jgi:hypothetical protein